MKNNQIYVFIYQNTKYSKNVGFKIAIYIFENQKSNL